MAREGNGSLPPFWMLCDGQDPTIIGFGLSHELDRACPGFRWVRAPMRIEGEVFLGLFQAPDVERARIAAQLVATLGDTTTQVFPGEAPAPEPSSSRPVGSKDAAA